MAQLTGKTALVTGASSGIGESTVGLLLSAGAKVYAAARRIEKMKGLEKKGAVTLSMDLTDEKSMEDTVNFILREAGSIDILVNNAGYGSYGAVEDVPLEEARRQFEVNIFGLARITQLVLPKMRENRCGRIVNVSSVGGKIYTPFGAWYHATKHALEGFTDCLRIEVEDFGIDAVVIEPGGIATPWGLISAENLKKTSGSGVYAKKAISSADQMTKRYSSGRFSPPSVIARAIMKAVTAGRPKTRYVAGTMARPLLFLRRWLSDRAFDRIVKSIL